jgi:hypothetical protein
VWSYDKGQHEEVSDNTRGSTEQKKYGGSLLEKENKRRIIKGHDHEARRFKQDK